MTYIHRTQNFHPNKDYKFCFFIQFPRWLFSSTACIMCFFRAVMHVSTSLLASQLWHEELGGGFKYFLFLPLFGEDSHFD